MLACKECAKLGTLHWEEKSKPKPPYPTKKATKPLPRTAMKQQPAVTLDESFELIGDLNVRVKRAREELGMTYEDLGRKIGEKVSVLRKIEGGKITPDQKVVSKLEHALKIKLLVPSSEPKLPSNFPPPHREVTLGEIVQLRKKKAEEEERKPS